MNSVKNDLQENTGISISYSLPANSSWWTFFKTDMFGRNYFNFKGRASRKEFWAFMILKLLFILFLSFILSFVFYFYKIESIVFVGKIIDILCFIPSLSLSVRRYHDLNMRGWWCLLLPVNLILPFFKGDRKGNRFGADIYIAEDDTESFLLQPMPVKMLFQAVLGQNFFNIHGRASRFEFCLITIFYAIIIYLLNLFGTEFAVLFFIFFAFYPICSVIIRRFHDLNMRGWWILLIISSILLFFVKGKDEDNRFGKNIYL